MCGANSDRNLTILSTKQYNSLLRNSTKGTSNIHLMMPVTYSFCFWGAYADLVDFVDFDDEGAVAAGSSSESSES